MSPHFGSTPAEQVASTIPSLEHGHDDTRGQLELTLFPETQTVSNAGDRQHEFHHEVAIDPVGIAPASVAEPSVGERLRRARENHGWTREDISARLKLQAGLVRRIEEDNYSGIAHAVYLRGYLTSYARLLGLPLSIADEVVATRSEETPLVSTGTISRSRYMLDRYSVSATYLILTGLV
ncbi:MAG: helix-turn-helix transcriptional regulator, partial [Dokdonella sp.]